MLSDRKSVHISNIDRLAIAQQRELSRGPKSKFETYCGISLPGFLVRRYNRLCIKLTIQQARTLNAIKLEETVDKDRIKDMYNKGQSIDGVSEIQYIQISALQE